MESVVLADLKAVVREPQRTLRAVSERRGARRRVCVVRGVWSGRAAPSAPATLEGQAGVLGFSAFLKHGEM